ncbi:hypothetical protein [Jiangella mangrovi]|uniref:Uncharacterized protein n=1 Tax=Jiangella mangrovi TaxID=1524084 RepID=A0A7W9LLI3_9ACTN|nr:hypothetical protein [Jiangella mangrovi]MBB5788218.1 hypothetical protein [Jiangella mangrovi]
MDVRGDWATDGRDFRAVVAGDVRRRGGSGWELVEHRGDAGRTGVFEVFREDGGALPVLSATAGEVAVPRHLVRRFTEAAVPDLVGPLLRPDGIDWLLGTLPLWLQLAGRYVVRWEGPEWPLGETPDGRPTRYSEEAEGARCLHWLRLVLDAGEVVADTYQDDDVSGLCLSSECPADPAAVDTAYVRLHTDLGLPHGRIERVALTIDDGLRAAGRHERCVLTEVELTVDGRPLLLMAAEREGDWWRRYDESVAVFRDPAVADRIVWWPARGSDR